MSSSAVALERRTVPPLPRGELRKFFDDALRRPVDRGAIALVAAPARTARPEALWRALPGEPTVLFDAPDGIRLAGVGIAIEARAEGSPTTARKAAEALLARASLECATAAAAPTPRLVGGFAFAAGRGGDPLWEPFGDGTLVLPRWTYVVEDGQPFLILARLRDDPSSVETRLAELDAIVDALAADDADPSEAPASLTVTHLDPAAWRAQLEAIFAELEATRLAKVVVARRSVVEAPAAFVGADVVAKLARRFPGCTRFAIGRDGALFIGASPERLVEKHELHVATEALAGSAPLGQAEALVASAKERLEHALVVDAIVEALRPFCADLGSSSGPRVRELPNMLHMQTPIEGTLARPTHVLDLVEALHPTPAVGGVPRREALAWIAEREPASRGWYGGPFGWIDAEGDGSFVVALRSGLLRGTTAWLFAGAGIVRGSEPDAELEETTLKMRALLDALGSDPAR